MGIEVNLRKFTGSFYIPLQIKFKEDLNWDERTPLVLDILPIMDKHGMIVSKMLTITEKNIIEKLEKRIPKIQDG